MTRNRKTIGTFNEPRVETERTGSIAKKRINSDWD